MARNLLQWGAAYLVQTMDQHAASPVLYKRGVDSVPWRAVKGRTAFEVADGEGGMVTSESVDWIGVAADLELSGTAVLPRRGDRIVDELGVEYEVLHPGGDTVFRWDESRTQLRIHTKRLSTDTNPVAVTPLNP